MQWGRVDYNKLPTEEDVTVDFPIHYTNACLNAQASRIVAPNQVGTDRNDGGILVVNYSKIHLTVNLAVYGADAQALRGFTWFTIGC